QGYESALASGPTLPDPTTVADAQRIVARYNLLPTLPPSIREVFEQRLRETPKESDPAFARAHFSLLLGAHDLLHAAHHALEAEGIYCIADHTTDNWPVEKAAVHLLSLLESTKSNDPKQRCAIVADGEVSSPVTGKGIGGRNSAFVLACVPKIVGKNITVLSAGTDGVDGNSPAAGAVADGETLARARAAGLDPGDFQRRSDSFNFFSTLDDAIITGPTGNNLRDLRILSPPWLHPSNKGSSLEKTLHPSAVNGDCGPIDRAGSLGRQKGDKRSKLIRPGQAPDGYFRTPGVENLVAGNSGDPRLLLCQLVEALRECVSRANIVHGDPARAKLICQRFSQARHRGTQRIRQKQAVNRLLHGYRSDGQKASPTVLLHARQNFTGEINCA